MAVSQISYHLVFSFVSINKACHFLIICTRKLNSSYMVRTLTCQTNFQGNNQKRVKKDKKADSTKKHAKPPTGGVKNEKVIYHLCVCVWGVVWCGIAYLSFPCVSS